MSDKIEKRSKKNKFKIGRGDPQKAMNFFNQATTTGQAPTGMTGGMGEAIDTEKSRKIERNLPKVKRSKNESINETTTSRVFQHIKSEEPWAIVSPYRSEYSDKENKRRMTEFKAKVRRMGYGFIHLVSRWVEDGVAFDEESLLIPKCSEDDATALGKEYEQRTIMVSHDGKCVEICTTPFENYSEGQIVRTFNLNNKTPMNIKDAEEIFSKRKGGPVSKPKSKRAKPFTLKEVFVVENPRPSYFQTRRTVLGEDAVNEVYPNKGESKEDFIKRFMSVTKDEYPDRKQRYAVANSYWERRNKK